MATRSRHERLEVSPEHSPDFGATSAAAPLAAGAPADADTPYVEPEQYGVRTTWQSEAVRIEAAEFLLATRVQEEKQWRLTRVIDRLRAARRIERGQ